MNFAKFHLPGLFEFYDLYNAFLPLLESHREYFYDYVEISSIYGSPSNTIWSGGRISYGEDDIQKSIDLCKRYNISPRFTFSNSLLEEKHLKDKKCNALCDEIQDECGIIIYSDLLLDYLKNKYPNFYFISSTTKVLLPFSKLKKELQREEFDYVVPDFRLNKDFEDLYTLSKEEREKVEFLCNECCYIGCNDRKACYENVSHKVFDEDYPDYICKAPYSNEGYVFSRAMQSPSFISNKDIQELYLPSNFTNFKIEGRGLGSALVLEFLLYYLIKPEYQIHVREHIYLDSYLDLF